MPAVSQRGFTMLEILMSLTIVSILAVAAVPLYMDYATKARIAEGLSLAGPVKSMVSEYYQITGHWPADNAQASLPEPTSYQTDIVDRITVDNSGGAGKITIAYNIPALGGNNTLTLTAGSADANVVIWRCAPGTITEKFLPSACKS